MKTLSLFIGGLASCIVIGFFLAAVSDGGARIYIDGQKHIVEFKK